MTRRGLGLSLVWLVACAGEGVVAEGGSSGEGSTTGAVDSADSLPPLTGADASSSGTAATDGTSDDGTIDDATDDGTTSDGTDDGTTGETTAMTTVTTTPTTDPTLSTTEGTTDGETDTTGEASSSDSGSTDSGSTDGTSTDSGSTDSGSTDGASTDGASESSTGGGTCVDFVIAGYGQPAALGSTDDEDDDLTASCGSASADVVLEWVAAETTTVIFTTDGSEFDTVLTLRDDCTGAELACDDDGGLGPASRIQWDVTAGESYFVAVEGSAGATGDYAFNVYPIPDADCCDTSPTATPGCQQGGCQAIVCRDDPSCCSTDWDLTCQSIAEMVCPVCWADVHCATTTPLYIADNTTLDVAIDVPSSVVIDGAEVAIDLRHSWLNDLDLRVTSPTGTDVDVFTFIPDSFGAICGGDDMQGVLFSDLSSNPLSCVEPGPPAMEGDYLPQNPLAAFDGEDGQGDWIVHLADTASADVGILNDVCVHIPGSG